jgi:adenylate cyclase class 1
VCLYLPTEELLQRVHRHLSSSFQLTPDTNPPAVEALFLMGSVGTIAHSRSSDIDVWVSHGQRIAPDQRQLLREKAEAITRYAGATLGLEIHFFLMRAEEFRAGERKALSAEDFGSTQHFLLLDEFYRSAILLAGKHPLWWFIATEVSDYDSAKQQLLREETLDFGNVHSISPGEYVGAGIWQLFKAISSPHKSLIKLLLIEIYSRQHPDNQPISQQIKSAVHQDGAGVIHDPYQLIHERLERYLLERGQDTRLELLRRALYFKTEVKLILLPKAAKWREQTLRNMTESWGWTHDHLRNLDMRNLWKVRRAREEHQSLVRELTGSYRFLQEFARDNEA